MNWIKRKMGRLLNVMIILLGLLLIAGGIMAKDNGIALTILVSIGTSLIASAIVSLLNAEYLTENERIKNLIKRWQLSSLYKTKADMNQESNAVLETCSSRIDIIAEGMHGFLSAKGEELREKLRQGVKIRIISCDNQTMLAQRAKDESLTGKKMNVDAAEEIKDLINWVDKSREIIPKCDLSIRFHSSYPACSYLRIDSKVFISPNMWLRPSQQSFAISFFEEGIGGEYFSKYFEQLWSGEFTHDHCELLNGK